MRTALFNALRARFLANPILRTGSRDILLDVTDRDRPNVTRPWTECIISKTASLDTFGSDIDEYEVECRFHSGTIMPVSTEAWLEAIRESFKDANITSYAFQCAGTRSQQDQGPSEADGGYDAAFTFVATLQRRVTNPATVGV